VTLRYQPDPEDYSNFVDIKAQVSSYCVQLISLRANVVETHVVTDGIVHCRLAVVAWPRRAVASLTRAQVLARGQPCPWCTAQARPWVSLAESVMPSEQVF
jgi:hypothetical protein